MQPPPWKKSPPSNPPLKIEVLSSPLLENLVGGSTPPPPPSREGAAGHYETCAQWSKDLFGLFLVPNTHSGRSKNAYQIDFSRL